MSETLTAEVWDAHHVLRWIETGKLALPDFQRRFEWNVSDVRSFLATVLAGLPSGSLLVSDNHNIKVQLRALEGAPDLATTDLAKMSVLLDGQQRLTALWQAVNDVGPERYFVDFGALLDGAELLQDSVVLSSSVANLRNYLGRAHSSAQILVPVSALYTRSHFFSWLQSPDRDRWERAASDEDLGAVFAEQLHVISSYRIPLTRLEGKLSLSTVAQIFERTNKGGQKLDAFDLLVARLQGAGWSLRDAWEDATRQYPEIERVFGDNGLSTISALSLLYQGDVRRSAVLTMPPAKISEMWSDAVPATRDVARLLFREGVRSPDLLPYDSIATAMVAARIEHASSDVLARYFWISAIGLRYETASNTRVVSDFRHIANDTFEDVAVTDDWLQSVDDIEMNTKRSSRALWASLISLILSNNPLDLATGTALSTPDAEGANAWELVSLVKGGGLVETERDVPARLRTAGQLVSTPGRSGALQRKGLVRLVRDRINNPELEIIGAQIEACLRSQLMPPSDAIVGGDFSPRELIRYRAAQIRERIALRVHEELRS